MTDILEMFQSPERTNPLNYVLCLLDNTKALRTNNKGSNTFFTLAVASIWAGKDTATSLSQSVSRNVCRSSNGSLENSAGEQVSHCEISKHSRLRTSLNIFIPRNKVVVTLLNKTSNLTIKLTANCASHNQDTLTVLTTLSIFHLILNSV